MKKLVIIALLFVSVITKVYPYFNRSQIFWINGTAYPFPLNYSISDLDIKGDITEVSERTYEAMTRFGEVSKEKLISKRDYIFEDERLKYLIVNEDDGYFRGKLTFYYNSQNRLIRVVFNTKPDGSYPMELTYSYDQEGRLYKVDYVNVKGEMLGRWVFEYSTNKDFKISEYGAWTGELNYEYFYVNGLLVKDINYSKLNGKLTTTYSYNQQRKLIKVNNYNKYIYTYQYNQKGWDNNYKYTIDAKGNWTLRIEKAEPGSSYKLAERTITYPTGGVKIEIPQNIKW